jgi:hypothetical protein
MIMASSVAFPLPTDHTTTPALEPQLAALVPQIAACAQAKLPHVNGRLTKATALVLAGAVQSSPLVQGGWRVQSQCRDTAYEVHDNSCTCADYTHRRAGDPELVCKHILATWLYRRAERRLATGCDSQPVSNLASGSVLKAVTEPEPGPALTPDTDVLTPYIVHLHGKPFVQYTGLLLLAQQRGLVSLKAHFISVTDTLALAEADATFADGKTYGECADSTPQNVGATVRPHFPRIALTRAKARVLRDALGVNMVALEELGEN